MYKKKLNQLNTDQITQLLNDFIDKDKKNEKKNHTKTSKTTNVSFNDSSGANRNYRHESIKGLIFALIGLVTAIIISLLVYFQYTN
jgi:hypothetical protein